MSRQDDLAYDSRDGDPVYHRPPPAGSGTADSFDNRHNEFPPERGHQGAAVDPRTGAPIHGDRTPMEAPSQSWQHGRDAAQPDGVGERDAVRLEHEGDARPEDRAPADER